MPFPTPVAACSDENGWEIHELNRRLGRDCRRFSRRHPDGRGATSAGSLFPVRGGYAFLQAQFSGPRTPYFLAAGSSTPTPITGCGCVNYMAAADDVITYIQHDPSGTSRSTLWISRAPFTTTTQVWNPGRNLISLSADPTNPRHQVLVAGDGDTLCLRNADVYYLDVDTIETTPPRALTAGAGTQYDPYIRGDRVVYFDYADDPSSPDGCDGDPHSVATIAMTSIARGGRTIVYRGTPRMNPSWLGDDRVYLTILGVGFAYVLLP